MAAIELLTYDCPRCQKPAVEEFYGPCRDCVVTLRAGQQLDRSDVKAAEYEPKMNVTPNAVATKE
jgi:hypothetical protein